MTRYHHMRPGLSTPGLNRVHVFLSVLAAAQLYSLFSHPVTKKARVSIAGCPAYDGGVAAAVNRAVSLAGGIETFLSPGMSVLVKPNLLTNAAPGAAVTTHPEVVRAVVRLVRGAGAEPFVADCPASVLKLESVWEKTGISAMCEQEGVPLVNLEEGGARRVNVAGFSFSIARRVLDADVVISVPKVKTHVLTGFTCGVKNLYGTIPGLQKLTLHKRYFNPAVFGRLIAAIYDQVHPAMTVADGVLAMEGNGPSAGDPVALGIVAASTDAAALDATLCRHVGLDPRAMTYYNAIAKGHLGILDARQIEVVGDEDATRPARPFRPPSTLALRLLPGWLVTLLGRLLWTRPAFGDACISCGLCVQSCPVNALHMEPASRPTLDRAACIACCCCHEICPHHAIEMEMSPLFRYARGRDQCLHDPNTNTKGRST